MCIAALLKPVAAGMLGSYMKWILKNANKAFRWLFGSPSGWFTLSAIYVALMGGENDLAMYLAGAAVSVFLLSNFTEFADNADFGRRIKRNRERRWREKQERPEQPINIRRIMDEGKILLDLLRRRPGLARKHDS
jgi:hypothetical protein